MDEPYLIGYARVSTDDQDLRLQIEALKRYGVPEDRIVTEKASGGKMDRRGLRVILKSLRDGDVLVVWKLDRLGRSLVGVIEAVETIEGQGANIVSITEKIDTSSAMGRAFFQITLVFAELERNMISERTKAGIAAARLSDAGKRWGRAHSIKDVPKRLDHVRKLLASGVLEQDPKTGAITGLSASQLRADLNEADRKAPEIVSDETVRRWLRAGAPGLDE